MKPIALLAILALLLSSCAPQMVRWKAPAGHTGDQVEADMRECGFGAWWSRGVPLIGPFPVILPLAGVLGVIRHVKCQERDECMVNKGYEKVETDAERGE